MFLKLIISGIALAGLALAQGGGMSGMGGGGGNGGVGTIGGAGRETGNAGAGAGMGPMRQKQTKADMMIERLKLNKDQQAEFITILQSTATDNAQVIQGLIQARTNYVNAMLSGKSEADMEPLAKALGEAQFQMTGVEVRAFQKIVAELKPNQLSKAPEAFDEMADIFLPVGGGAGMGRGMGRGGR